MWWVAVLLGLGGQARAELLLTGAGATFPYPLYARWFREFGKLRPEYHFNYQAIGSGGGVRQMLAGTVDFGATDVPLTDEEARTGLHHIPMVLGAIALVYSGVPDGLRLDAPTLADILLGKIRRWDDARLVALNPDMKLPAEPLVVVHRSDGSGSTLVLTDWLSSASPTFAREVGVGKSIRWPTGIGAKGNDAVTAVVSMTPHTIGYVELSYARQSRLPVAALRNVSGAWVRPTLAGIAAAASSVSVPADFRASLTAAPSPEAYPLSSFTYLIVPRTLTADKGRALLDFLWWALHDGQELAPALDYAPLPSLLMPRVEALLRQVSAAGG